MNIKEIISALDSLQLGRSPYEFENFFLESYPTSARQLVAVMREIESLHAEQLVLENQLSTNPSAGERIILERQLKIAENKYSQLVSWYQGIDPDMRTAILGSLDTQEPEYWANYLGRQAALELLSTGKTSKATMDQMSNLPVDAFEEAVRICVRYANLIRETTSSVEQSMGISTVAGTPSN